MECLVLHNWVLKTEEITITNSGITSIWASIRFEEYPFHIADD